MRDPSERCHPTRRVLAVFRFAAVFLILAPASRAAALPAAYEQAMDLLVRGRRYERAALLLQGAEKERPADYRIPLALGCAYADRAAALSYAASYALSDAVYQANLPREKRENRIFRLKDDGTPFKDTREGTAARFSSLAGKASDAWERAEKMARSGDAVAEAEAAFVHAEGLRLLGRYNKLADPRPRGAGSPPPGFDRPLDPALPEDAEVIRLLQTAVKAAPKAAVYWRALGDALPDGSPEAEAAYRKSLTLDPRVGTLWYLLYVKGQKPDGSAAPVDDLENAARYDRSNGFYAFLAAAERLRAAKMDSWAVRPEAPSATARTLTPVQEKAADDAVSWLEQGSAAARCAAPDYFPAMPRAVEAAWSYAYRNRIPLLSYTIRLREMARTVDDVAEMAARNGDPARAERAASALLAMGRRMAGDPREPLSASGGICFTGDAIVGIGYTALADVRAASGDGAAADDLRQQAAAYQKLARKRLEDVLKENDAPYRDY